MVAHKIACQTRYTFFGLRGVRLKEGHEGYPAHWAAPISCLVANHM